MHLEEQVAHSSHATRGDEYLLLRQVLIPTMRPCSSSTTLHALGCLPHTVFPRTPFSPLLSCSYQPPAMGPPQTTSFLGLDACPRASLHPLLYSLHSFSVHMFLCRHWALLGSRSDGTPRMRFSLALSEAEKKPSKCLNKLSITLGLSP